MVTTKLNNGATVVGKVVKGRVWAYTFANRTQAERCAERCRTEGHDVFVTNFMGRPFYVVVSE